MQMLCFGYQEITRACTGTSNNQFLPDSAGKHIGDIYFTLFKLSRNYPSFPYNDISAHFITIYKKLKGCNRILHILVVTFK